MAGKKDQVGSIKDISGEVDIAGSDIYTRYTADQLSARFAQILQVGC